jgi:hypothetical protein
MPIHLRVCNRICVCIFNFSSVFFFHYQILYSERRICSLLSGRQL